MNTEFAAMTIDHYDDVRALWERTENISLSVSDSREGIARYLARNPQMSFVALEDGRIIGAVLCGHDGRRGYITHLAVDAACRRRGIGSALVQLAVAALEREGLAGCNLFIWRDNAGGRAFWRSHGWHWPDSWGVMNRRFIDDY